MITKIIKKGIFHNKTRKLHLRYFSIMILHKFKGNLKSSKSAGFKGNQIGIIFDKTD